LGERCPLQFKQSGLARSLIHSQTGLGILLNHPKTRGGRRDPVFRCKKFFEKDVSGHDLF
jgi:hypothetical protein